jgi:GNAT superfamily N-acetyltransferase
MRIEAAISSDITALNELLAELFSQEQEFAPNSEAQPKGLLMIINNPDAGVVLLARRGEKIVGMVNILFTISTALGARVALLEDMIIASASRGEKIGTQLLTEAILLARSRGCKRITLLTDGANKSAQRFYAKQGFIVSSMIPMRISLE